MFKRLFATLCLFASLSAAASVQFSNHTWTLQTGTIEYKLQEANAKGAPPALAYFGPVGGRWSQPPRIDFSGIVEGQRIDSANVRFIKAETQLNGTELVLTLQHRNLPLRIIIRYATHGNTGVITRQITLANDGKLPLAVESLPSVALQLPGDNYSVSYLHGNWGEERQLSTDALTRTGMHLTNKSGRSSAGFSPWFVLSADKANVRYAAQLATSGNWQLDFDAPQDTRHSPLSESPLHVTLGSHFDFGGAARLAPNDVLALPAVAFTATTGDLDDAANNLHRYQRTVIAHTSTNTPPLIVFNTWQMMRRNPTADQVKHYADLIAPIGIEGLVIDSGWFRHIHQPTPTSPADPKAFPIFGDWESDPEYFPKGLRDVSDYVHGKGMKFGVWVEIETVSRKSEVARLHPDWMLSYNGKPIAGGADRIYLNFAIPAARAWARSVFERLITQDKVDWFKLDYNVNPGDEFDPSSPSERTGTVLDQHHAAYYALLDEVRIAHPDVVLENCASGGLRANIAILSHTHTSWTSDVIEPKRNAQLDYGCTVEFVPEVCEHWMTGDPNGDSSGDSEKGEVHAQSSRAWMETMMRLPMAGQLGFSSIVPDWPAEFREVAVQGIADYKRIRPIIAAADTYHLTPPPAAGPHPQGWLAIEFAQPAEHDLSANTATHAVVLAVRLENGEAARALHLRGLDPSARYGVTINRKASGSMTGAELHDRGLNVALTNDWDSALIELQRQP